MRITASKAKKFQEVLRMVHPKVADLGRLVVSRTSSATSMTSLAMRIMTLLQRLADANPEEADQVIDQQRNSVLQVADWAAATGNGWKQLSSLDELYREAEIWHDQFTPDEAVEYQSEDPVEMDFEDGWYIVKLLPENAHAEGELMGHCVASYEDDIRNGSKVVYSLRDPNNKPHVTFNTMFEFDEEAAKYDAEHAADEQHELEREEDLPSLLDEAASDAAYEAENKFLRANDIEWYDSEEDFERERDEAIEKAENDARAEKERDWEDEWNLRGRDRWIAEKLQDLKNYERESYMKGSLEQIQGKEDEPPINRYRKYLRDFVNSELRGIDIKDVKNRLMDVNTAIEGLIANPERNSSLLTSRDIRTQDLAPYFEMQISNPQDLPYNVLGRVMLYAINMMSKTQDPRYRDYALAALRFPNGPRAVRSISVGAFDPILKIGDEAVRWVYERLREAKTEDEVLNIVGDASKWPRAMINNPQWSEAVQEKLRRLMTEKDREFAEFSETGDPGENEEFMKNEMYVSTYFMLKNIASVIGRGGLNLDAVQRFRDLLAILGERQRWLTQNIDRNKNTRLFDVKQLGFSNDAIRVIEDIMAHIWWGDRDLFSQVAAEIPSQILERVKNQFQNAYPRMVVTHSNLALPVVDPQFQLGETRPDVPSERNRRGRVPEDLRGPSHDRLVDDLMLNELNRAEKNRPQRHESPLQTRMDFASSRGRVLRLAAILEDVLPEAADFLERHALSEV